MNSEQKVAYEWAKNQNYQSVAARYAKTLADLIESQQAQLTDYHHMEQLVDGKMAENQRLRKINEKLQSQLTASQRREQAAVEGLEYLMANQYDNAWICDHCAKKPAIGETCKECNPEWRGPQEAGKGEAE